MLGITLGREGGPGGLSSAVSVDNRQGHTTWASSHRYGTLLAIDLSILTIFAHLLMNFNTPIYLQLAHRPAHLVTIKMAKCKLASSIRMYSLVLILTDRALTVTF